MNLSSKRKSIGLAVAAGTAGLMISTSAQAVTGNWIGPTNSGWSNSAAWQDGIIPNAQGDTAQYVANNGSQVTLVDVPGGVRVGTLRVAATTNVSWQVRPVNDVIMDQDGYAGPGRASIINDIQSTTTTTNPAIFVNSNTGWLTLNDDLFISNTSNSTRTSGAIQMQTKIQGNGTVTIENISNDIGAGQVAFTGQGNFGGDIFINKGAVTFTRGDIFTPSPDKFVYLGAPGMGDVTLAAVGGGLGNIENEFVAVANTGGKTVFAANSSNANNINIKSSASNAAFVRLDGNLNLENRASNGSTFVIGDPISGFGRLTKAGVGPVRLTHGNIYQGGTVVDIGVLSVGFADAINNGFGFYFATAGALGSGDVTVKNTATQLQIETGASTNAIADTAALSVEAGAPAGVVALQSGINDTIGGLVLGGEAQTINGTYGSTSSGADFQNDTYFSGPGVVNLVLGRTLHWDINGDTAGAGGATPSGTWGGDKVVFNTDAAGGAGGTLSYNSIATDPVVFTAGTDGTGSYTVTVNGTQNAASVSVARGNVTMSGSGTVNTPTVDVASGATATVTSGLSGPLNVLSKTGTGTLQVSKLPQAHAMNVAAGTVRILESSPGVSSGHPSGDDAFVSQPSSLNISDGATLDITNNDVVIDYSGTSPVAALEALVASGYNLTGDWQGDGIVSSIAANDGNYVVAIADNATLAAPFGTAQGGPLFAGVDVDLDTVLIKFTHRADINLDGLVTPDDSAVFGGNYDEGQPATWATGDMNYDGIFTPDDAAIFGGAYDESLASLPEPGSLAALGLLGLGLARRRRRS